MVSYRELDRLRDRIVLVVMFDSLIAARFERAERNVMAIAEGRSAAASDEVRRIEYEIMQGFLARYRAAPGLAEPEMMFAGDLFVVSLAESCVSDVPAIVRAAAATQAGETRVSVTRTWESRYPTLGGHEYAVDSSELGFEELSVCARLAGELGARLGQSSRADELRELIVTLTQLYATRIDGDGDDVSLHRLSDGSPVSRSELEQRAADLGG